MLWDPAAYFHGYLQISNEFKDEVKWKSQESVWELSLKSVELLLIFRGKRPKSGCGERSQVWGMEA